MEARSRESTGGERDGHRKGAAAAAIWADVDGGSAMLQAATSRCMAFSRQRNRAETVSGEGWTANCRSGETFVGNFVVIDRANIDREITMKYYFNDYLIPKLKDIIKILLLNENKIFWEDVPKF